MCAKEDSTKNQIEQPKKEERFSPNPTKAHQKTSKQVCRSKLAPTGQLLQLPNSTNGIYAEHSHKKKSCNLGKGIYDERAFRDGSRALDGSL